MLLASLFDHCLVNEHNRYVILYRINALALRAFQTAPVRLQLDFHLADGARKYFKQPLAYSQFAPPVIKGSSLTLENYMVKFRSRSELAGLLRVAEEIN